MAKLDVELGKAVGIQRTKAGSGDKEEAFLIRSTLLKFAGAFCLVFLIVGGLAIFLSQWEVSFQQGINLNERVEHQAVEQEAFNQFMQVGNMLTGFLRAETQKKQTVAVVQTEFKAAYEELLKALDLATSSDDIHTLVNGFSDKIYGVLDTYADMVAQESATAKEMLGTINNIMADDEVMPQSREKIRTIKGNKGILQKTKVAKEGARGKGGAAAKEARPRAQSKLAAMGGDLQATINRVFSRVELLDTLSFPEQTKNDLVALQHEIQGAAAQKGDLQPFLVKFRDLLKARGVRGVDVVAATSSERQMVMTLKEIVQLFPVLDHVTDLEALKIKWESEQLNEGEVMHALHKLTRDHILPFEWIAGDRPFGGMLSPKQGGKGKAPPALFQHTQKYQWWQALGAK